MYIALKLPAIAAILVTASLWPATAIAQVSNGDFEQGGQGWVQIQISPDCDAPGVVDGVNLPTPPGPGEGRQHAALLGDLATTDNPGCNPSVIYQTFECDHAPGGEYCSVSFDAECFGCEGGAYLYIVKDQIVRVWRIPCGGRGTSGRYTASVRGCGEVTVRFVLYNRNAGVRSAMYIDNVTSACASSSRKSEALKMVDASVVPSFPNGDSLLTHMPLAVRESPRDCNNDHVPDIVEICNDGSLDANDDGQLDSCAPREKKINWILLLMGVVLIVVTLWRKVIENRSQYR